MSSTRLPSAVVAPAALVLGDVGPEDVQLERDRGRWIGDVEVVLHEALAGLSADLRRRDRRLRSARSSVTVDHRARPGGRHRNERRRQPSLMEPVWRQAMGHSQYDPGVKGRKPWNAGRKLGAKRALKPQQVWAIRFWLDQDGRVRDRAMFDLAIDSKLRGCDVVKIRTGDLVSGGRVRSRAIIVQRKAAGLCSSSFLSLPGRASSPGLNVEAALSRCPRLPEPDRPHQAHQHSAVRPARGRMGDRDRTAPGGLRDALAAADQGLDHLQTERQLASGADPAWPYEDRERRPIPWRRH